MQISCQSHSRRPKATTFFDGETAWPLTVRPSRNIAGQASGALFNMSPRDFESLRRYQFSTLHLWHTCFAHLPQVICGLLCNPRISMATVLYS